MRKAIAALLLLCVTYSAFAAGPFYATRYRIAHRGYINIFSLLENYEIDYRYQPYIFKLSIREGGHFIELLAGEKTLFLNNKLTMLPVAPFIEKGAFYVPVSALRALIPYLFFSEYKEGKKLALQREGEFLYITYAGEAIPDLIIKPTPETNVVTNVPVIPPPETNVVVAATNEHVTNVILPGANETNHTIDVIIIDPGHGGKDPGAVGINDVYEKDLVLTYAKDLRAHLKKMLSPLPEIYLTREDDTFIPLGDRATFANAKAGVGTKMPKNGLFISLHANAHFSTNAEGFEVFFLTAEESSDYARSIASFENSVTIDFERNAFSYTNDFGSIYHTMLIEQYQRESKVLAELVIHNVKKAPMDVTFRSEPLQSALFYVLKGVLMPAILVEVGFVTSPCELEKLRTMKYRTRMTESLALAVKDYTTLFHTTKGFTEESR